MDSSLTRRGQICWYQKPGIGLDAINDALLLEASIYRLLKFYCREQPYYLNLLELFLQVHCSGAGDPHLSPVALASVARALLC